MEKKPKGRKVLGIACFYAVYILLHICRCEGDLSFTDLQEIWVKNGHNIICSRCDDQIGFYQDGQTKTRYDWSDFKYYSNAWKKAKMLYNATNFGNDSQLYVIVYKNLNDDHNEIHTNFSFDHLNIIFCEENYQHRDRNFECGVDNFFEVLVDAVVKKIVASDYFPLHMVSDWKVEDIIWVSTVLELKFYKLYKRELYFTWDFPQEYTQLFQFWYEPIYDNHGESKVIHSFLDVIQKASQQDSSMRNRTISPGEYVHIWSMAAQYDLRQIAYGAFGWTKEYRKQYMLARTRISAFSYKDSFTNKSSFSPVYRCNVSLDTLEAQFVWKPYTGINSETHLVHLEQDVAFCSPRELSNRTLLISKKLAEAWSYVKKTYGPLGPDPYLFVRISNHEYINAEYCVPNREFSYMSHNKDDNARDQMRLLCYEKEEQVQQDSITFTDLQEKILPLALLLLATSKETGDWPAYTISEAEAAYIIEYDIYIFLELFDEAQKCADEYFNSSIEVPKSNTFWFRDWYFPIYTHFNGSLALAAFIEQQDIYWPKKGTNYMEQLNVGEFVHFWSMAVNTDLRDLAAKTFGWSEEYEQQYKKAKMEYVNFNYTDTFRNGTFSSPWTMMNYSLTETHVNKENDYKDENISNETIFKDSKEYEQEYQNASIEYRDHDYAVFPDAANTKKQPNKTHLQLPSAERNTDMIIAISDPVCLIICAVVVTLVVFQCRKVTKSNAQKRKLASTELTEFVEGGLRMEGAKENPCIEPESSKKNSEIVQDVHKSLA